MDGIPQGQYMMLISHFGLNTTGKKGSKFPAKNSVRPCKPVCPGIKIKVDANESSSESGALLPYKYDVK